MHTLYVHPHIHTPHIHSCRQHTHVHAQHPLLHMCAFRVHIPLVCTRYEHMQAQMHTHGHAHVYRSFGWKELRQRPYHPTHSSEHLSCAIQTLKDPCPCSICVSECYRAAVSGDPLIQSSHRAAVSRGPPLRSATELQFQGEHPQSHYCFLFAMPPSQLLGLGRWGQTVRMVGPSLASGFLRISHPVAAKSHSHPLPAYTTLTEAGHGESWAVIALQGRPQHLSLRRPDWAEQARGYQVLGGRVKTK